MASTYLNLSTIAGDLPRVSSAQSMSALGILDTVVNQTASPATSMIDLATDFSKLSISSTRGISFVDDIPTELRLMVYRYLFQDLLFTFHDTKTCRLRPSNFTIATKRPANAHCLPTQVALFTTCRTIYDEAGPIFLSEARFRPGLCLMDTSNQKINRLISGPLPWSLNDRFTNNAAMSRVLANIKHFDFGCSRAAGLLEGLNNLRGRVVGQPQERIRASVRLTVVVNGEFEDASDVRGEFSGKRSLIQRLMSAARGAVGELRWTWQPRESGSPLRTFTVVYKPFDGIVEITCDEGMIDDMVEFRQVEKRMRLYFGDAESMSLWIPSKQLVNLSNTSLKKRKRAESAVNESKKRCHTSQARTSNDAGQREAQMAS